MKTVNYRLQTEIERLGPLGQEEWFKNYFREILESDKPYYVKSDYIALSFLELENKIAYLDNEIRTLSTLKKRLGEARKRGLEIAASMLKEYGIEKMEGTLISSLTISPEKAKRKELLRIKDPRKVMELGFVTFSVDEKLLKEALTKDPERNKEVLPYVEIETVEETTPARLKINKRRNVSLETGTAPELLSAA